MTQSDVHAGCGPAVAGRKDQMKAKLTPVQVMLTGPEVRKWLRATKEAIS